MEPIPGTASEAKNLRWRPDRPGPVIKYSTLGFCFACFFKKVAIT